MWNFQIEHCQLVCQNPDHLCLLDLALEFLLLNILATGNLQNTRWNLGELCTDIFLHFLILFSWEKLVKLDESFWFFLVSETFSETFSEINENRIEFDVGKQTRIEHLFWGFLLLFQHNYDFHRLIFLQKIMKHIVVSFNFKGQCLSRFEYFNKICIFSKKHLFVKTERSTMVHLVDNFKALRIFSFQKIFRPDKSFLSILFISRQKKL